MVEWVLGGLGLGLFGYNRKNFMFDSEQQIKREYQGQNMRIKQFELYREDVRDLVDLTVSKMDNYLVVGTLQLGFTVRFFCEGCPLPDKWPPWLIWLWAAANIGAFMYFLLSMWLAMHASIAAHSFGVRVLTQFVRLPVPTREKLDAARARAEDYEGLQLRDMVRIPLLRQQLRRLNETMASSTAVEGVGSSAPAAGAEEMAQGAQRVVDLEHIVLYRQAQENWQAYDAYARVCMAMGTNQLLHSLIFYCLGLLIVEIQAPATGFCCIIVFEVCAFLIVNLDIYDCSGQPTLKVAAVLLFTPSSLIGLSTIAGETRSSAFKTFGQVLVPFAFFVHACWIAFMVRNAQPRQIDQVSLPTKFRSVLYLDVFGWLPCSRSCQQLTGDQTFGPTPATPRASPAREEAMPQNLRTSLLELCQRLYNELERELACWNSEEVSEVASELTLERVANLRRQFQVNAEEFSRSGQMAPQQLPEEPNEALWLKLELSTSSGAVEFFYETGSGNVRCTQPDTSETILTLASLEEKLEVFADKVRTLAQFPQSPLAAAPSELPHPRVARSPSTVTSTTQSSREPALDHGQVAERDGNVGGTQDDFVELVDVAASYQPHRGRGSVELDTARSQQRRPGHMPWRTFLHGSLVLVALWLLGTLASLYMVLFQKRSTPPKPSGLMRWRRDDLDVDVASPGSTPHPFFRPRGVACHPAFGPSLFIAGAYRVYELRLDGASGPSSPLRWQPALGDCLAGAPQFSAGGIGGISMSCQALQAGLQCEVLVLSAGGRSVLRCGVASIAARETTSGSSSRGRNNNGAGSSAREPLVLHGGPWRTLVASDAGDGFWAVEAETIVQMRPRLGHEGELVPRLVLAEGVPRNMTQWQALADGTVLGLEVGTAASVLHRWREEDGGRQSRLGRLPEHAEWVGACADLARLYLVGVAKADGLVVVGTTTLS